MVVFTEEVEAVEATVVVAGTVVVTVDRSDTDAARALNVVIVVDSNRITGNSQVARSNTLLRRRPPWMVAGGWAKPRRRRQESVEGATSMKVHAKTHSDTTKRPKWHVTMLRRD